MSTGRNEHWGSTLDEFLAEEGVKQATRAEAWTRARAFLSQDEFFARVETLEGRYELVDGEMTKRAAANQRHQDIAANILAALHGQLRGGKCRPTAADTAVVAKDNVRYPDIVVDCGKRDDRALRATTPTLVVEVLSQSTKTFDSHKKLNEYKSHPDMRFVLLVDTDSARVLQHYRVGDIWREQAFDRLDDVIELADIGAKLALADVYFGVDFETKAARG